MKEKSFPTRLGYLFIGVLMGLALGAIPGLGGLVGLAILLPFTFDMDSFEAFAIMIGLISVTSTSDTIPSVLFGVPGTSASQATILDGHPMAKRGEAGRAFGAAYMASLLGGVFGSLVLALSIPVLRPIVLAFGSPEFFMLGLLGISMVAVLSGNAPVKGLIVGALGLCVGMVGMDPLTGVLRWVFGELYLWDGVPLVPVALGVFAIPEIVDLTIRGTRIADVPKERLKGVTAGIRGYLPQLVPGPALRRGGGFRRGHPGVGRVGGGLVRLWARDTDGEGRQRDLWHGRRARSACAGSRQQRQGGRGPDPHHRLRRSGQRVHGAVAGGHDHPGPDPGLGPCSPRTLRLPTR